VAFWIITLLISFIPGYFYPQIFTYGWQYGYFPGFVWDESLSLGGAYWWSRVIVAFYGVIFLLYAKTTLTASAETIKEWKRRPNKYIWIIALATPLFLFELGRLGIVHSGEEVEEYLKDQKVIDGYIVFHYTFTAFTPEEQTLLFERTAKEIEEIRTAYGLKQKNKIEIYIYPSVQELNNYIGTRSASITKPWLGEVHIAKENLGSLKHELTHILLRERGSFPFDISWSTGLTEGAAVAMEDSYDGIHSADELAAWILHLDLSKGVSSIMQFTGFAADAAGKSYVLAGSFSSYLMKTYGADKYLSVYSSRDFQSVYGKSIETLDAEWRNSLSPLVTEPNSYDTLRTKYYFDRRSIINEPCLRRIGRLMKKADEAFAEKNYVEADELYSEVLAESDRTSALRGRIFCAMKRGDAKAALALLDTSSAAKISQNSIGLHNLKGDLIFLATEDIQQARSEWEEAMKLELGERQFLQAFARYYCLAAASEKENVREILRKNFSDDRSYEKNLELLNSLSIDIDMIDADFDLAKHVLLFRYYESLGRLRDAYSEVKEGLKLRDLFASEKRSPAKTCLAILSRYADEYARVFKEEQPLSSR
jgi:hypothetical protein